MLRLLGVGWYVGLSISGGGLGGYFLDRWLGISPLITVMGLIVGVALAITGMYWMLSIVFASSQGKIDKSRGSDRTVD